MLHAMAVRGCWMTAQEEDADADESMAAANKVAGRQVVQERCHVFKSSAAYEDDMMLIDSTGSKIGGTGAAAYRWSGDAVPLKRRRVGLSNGDSLSEEGSFDEEEDVGSADDVSGDEEESSEGIVMADGVGVLEDEDGDDDDSEDVVEEANHEENEYNEPVLMTDRGGGRSRRAEEQELEPESVRFGDHEAGTDDDASDEDPGVAESPIVSGGGREFERESVSPDVVRQITYDMTDRGGGRSRRAEEQESEPDSVRFGGHEARTEDDASDEDFGVADSPIVSGGGREFEREAVSPDVVRQITYDSDEDAVVSIPRGAVEQRQASQMVGEVIPEKPMKVAKRLVKRKAEAMPRNGGEPKSKEKAPRKKSNADGTRERARFSADNKARVTLERAREILAAVKAAMVNDSKQLSMRYTDTRTVQNSSSSEDERVPIHPPPRMIQQQVESQEKISKKGSRAKGDKEPTPRRRKPKAKVDHKAEENVLRHNSKAGVLEHENTISLCQYSTSSVEVAGDGRGFDEESGFEKKEFFEMKKVSEKKIRKRRKSKEAESDPSSVGLCPGSVLRDETWEPPLSPFGLIQETLYKDPWKVLLSCMLLNKTAGRQMHKVIWDLFTLCPDAHTAVTMDSEKIAEKVYSLGLQNKRAKMIQRFSHEYLRGDWTNVTQLHGIGKYAADAYAIFCQGLWRDVEPDDVQLVKYWKWLWETNGMGSAFVPEDS